MRFKLILFLVVSFCVARTHSEGAEKHAFQAEVSRMMKLIINSLYTNKEVFLRELISNASDALDKIRVLALTNKDTLDSLGELDIRIKPNEKENTLSIQDTGIGMSKQELMNNLGTIAKSGTSEFLKQNLDNPDQVQLTDLIGQFGVGFYSAFLVADKVVVTSKSDQDPIQHVWESNSTEYSIADNGDDEDVKLERGTVITLHLKEEAKDFLKEDTLREVIKKYSQFINFPIYLWTSKTVKEELDKTDDVAEEIKEADEEKKEDSEEKKGTTQKKTVEKQVWDWERINVAKPIWQRKPSEVNDDEYKEFYKSLTRDHQEPLAKSHFTAEGELTFKSLLFIPKQQPIDSFNKYGSKSDNIKLYVRRVFISDEFNDLIPSYLNFVRGVVDSDDLPLNVGRETLQQHKLLKVIKRKLVRKTLDMIRQIDDKKYDDFWREFSTNMKLGIIEDQSNRNRIAKLLRFHSSKTGPDGWTSLAQYVKDMPEGQDQIYYIAGSSFDEVSNSPFVEKILKKGHEVLYLTDAVDEYCLSNLPDFEDKKFQSVAKEGLKVDTSAKAESYKKWLEKKYSSLVSWLKESALKDRVQNVVLSDRLSESPAALVATAFGWTGNMERLAKSNAHSKTKDATRDYYLSQKKILEINPHHPIIKELSKRVADDDGDDNRAKQTAELLFETATIRSGYMLPDTEEFGKRVERLMRLNLDVPEDAPVEEDPQEDEADGDSSDEKRDEL